VTTFFLFLLLGDKEMHGHQDWNVRDQTNFKKVLHNFNDQHNSLKTFKV